MPDDVDMIRQALERTGRSYADLARFMNWNPSQVTRLLKRQRALKAEELRRIMGWLATPVSPVSSSANGSSVDTRGAVNKHDAFPFHPIPVDRMETGERDLPIYGSVRGGVGGDAVDLASPVEWVVRPLLLAGVNGAFGLYVVGTSMEPRFNPGEMILVHPGRPLTRGCDVVVVFSDNSAILKRFLRANDKFVEVEQLNPPGKQQLAKGDIGGVYRVVGWQDSTR